MSNNEQYRARFLAGLTDAIGLEEVQRMLGHESLDTTMIYAKTDNSQVKLNHERYVS